LCGLFATACSTPHEEASLEQRIETLQNGLAAKVGDETISVEQVQQLSHALQISQEEARSRLVYDALFAAEAKSKGYQNRGDITGQRRAAIARVLIDQLKREAHADPITDEEVARHTGLHWLDMDRPVARRTVHAVVLPKKPDDAAEWTKADGVARKIAEAVRGEKDAEQFKKAAEGVDDEGMKVIVQDLPPVAADGRVADLASRPPPGMPTATFDASFVKAVFSLSAVGDQASSVRSAFGTHVVMLVAVQESSLLDVEVRRAMLAEEIRATRVREKLEVMLSSLLAQTPPKVERSVGAMLDLVSESLARAPEQGP